MTRTVSIIRPGKDSLCSEESPNVTEFPGVVGASSKESDMGTRLYENELQGRERESESQSKRSTRFLEGSEIV